VAVFLATQFQTRFLATTRYLAENEQIKNLDFFRRKHVQFSVQKRLLG